jgi:hypothetical protein
MCYELGGRRRGVVGKKEVAQLGVLVLRPSTRCSRLRAALAFSSLFVGWGLED